jgi:putative tryptophan/tyrosine transport system substrate-binding protein
VKRRAFIAGLGSAAAWPVMARAQQPNRVRRVGMLNFSDGKDEVAQFFVKDLRKSLEDLGWNIELDVQWGGGGERGRANAEQLMTRTPDAIVANGTAMLVAAQQVTRSVPIVFFNVSDPVGGGLLQSMSRPGGNSTGFTNYEDALAGKWLEILKEAIPNLERAFAMQDPLSPAWVGQQKSLKSAAVSLGVQLVPAEVRATRDIQNSIDSARGEQNVGFVVMPSVITVAQRPLILDLNLKYKIPAIYPFSMFAKEGGLISYGTSGTGVMKGVASYLDRIFRGERPADMPVQAPTQLELLINRKTAKEIGAEISPALLARADEVIE